MKIQVEQLPTRKCSPCTKLEIAYGTSSSWNLFVVQSRGYYLAGYAARVLTRVVTASYRGARLVIEEPQAPALASTSCTR